MSDLGDPFAGPFPPIESDHELSQLWVISYSDFMTILMIFFLMLFAHRLWAKSVVWEKEKASQLRAVQETQKGIVQRLNRLAQVEVQAERIDIHLPSALLFDAGKADLRPQAAELLAKLAPELAQFPGEVVVEGHTDDQPIGDRARFASNWELSVARAFSVIHSFTDHGVSPQHISARGYGPYRPRVLNDSPDHRGENRRIEIVLLNRKKG